MLAYKPTNKAAIVGGIFDWSEGDRREALLDTLRQGPEAALGDAQKEDAIPPSRWQLTTIREAIPWLGDYTLSGVWRLLQRYKLKLRSGRVQQYSPDPDYKEKEAHLLSCLQTTANNPERIVFLFLDEMGYYRWPDTAPTWSPEAPEGAPVADRRQSKQQQWRLIGVLNALTGQVDFLDAYIVGRKKVIQMYEVVNQRYDWADQIFVGQDNWSIHKHADVQAALETLPRIKPIWLPTYAPWLNPIEKLWRWLRQDILKMHRLAGAWSKLQARVRQFLARFAAGSADLLRYVGLAGSGKLAQAIQVA